MVGYLARKSEQVGCVEWSQQIVCIKNSFTPIEGNTHNVYVKGT